MPMPSDYEVLDALRVVYDPEIRVNIVDLGLIYSVDVRDDGFVLIKMTLTSPGCPVSGQIKADIERIVRRMSGVSDLEIELVWDPPWGPMMMSEEAKLMLGYDI